MDCEKVIKEVKGKEVVEGIEEETDKPKEAEGDGRLGDTLGRSETKGWFRRHTCLVKNCVCIASQLLSQIRGEPAKMPSTMEVSQAVKELKDELQYSDCYFCEQPLSSEEEKGAGDNNLKRKKGEPSCLTPSTPPRKRPHASMEVWEAAEASGCTLERFVWCLVGLGFSLETIHAVVQIVFPTEPSLVVAVSHAMEALLVLENEAAAEGGISGRSSTPAELLFASSGCRDSGESLHLKLSSLFPSSDWEGSTDCKGGCGGVVIPLGAIAQLDKAELKTTLDGLGAAAGGSRNTMLGTLTSQFKSSLPPGFVLDFEMPERSPGLGVCLLCPLVVCLVCGESGGQHQALCSLRQAQSILHVLKRLDQALTKDSVPRPVKSTPVKRSANERVEKGGGQTVWAAGTGFGGSMQENFDNAAAKTAQDKIDAAIQDALEELVEILREYRMCGVALPGPICTLLHECCALWRSLRSLLQNASFMEAANRKPLFQALLATLEELAEHEDLIPLLRLLPPGTPNTPGMTGPPTSAPDGNGQETGTFLDALKVLRSQSELLLQISQEGPQEEGRESQENLALQLEKLDMEDMNVDDVESDTALARKVISCYDSLARHADTCPLVNLGAPSTSSAKPLSNGEESRECASLKPERGEPSSAQLNSPGASKEKTAVAEIDSSTFESLVVCLGDMGFPLDRIHDVARRVLSTHTYLDDAICHAMECLDELESKPANGGESSRQASRPDAPSTSTAPRDSTVRDPCPGTGCGGTMMHLQEVELLDEADLKAALTRFGMSTWGARSNLLEKLTAQVKADLVPGSVLDFNLPEMSPGLQVCLLCRHVECSVCDKAQGDHTPFCSAKETKISVRQLLERLAASLEDDSLLNKPANMSVGSQQIPAWAAAAGFGGEGEDELDNGGPVNTQEGIDESIQKALAELTEILGQYRAYGLLLPVRITYLLNDRQRIWHSLGMILRNASFKEATRRRVLFLELFATLEEFSKHEQLIPLLLLPSPAAASDRTGASTSGSHGDDEDIGTFLDAVTGLCLESECVFPRLRQQAKLSKVLELCETEGSDMEGNPGDDVASDLDFAKKLMTCYDALAPRVKTRIFGPLDGPSVSYPRGSIFSADEALKDKYKEALQNFQLRQVSFLDDHGHYEHFFRGTIDSMCNGIDTKGVQNKKRASRIAKEIASLTTSLPLEWASSIYVCVDESRVDVLKALIIGPADTPYQNGIFLFDILLPADYPDSPPQVQFLTTGGGSVRFNPNLYETGYVCLSLLGTWSGPGWDPQNSTLLQVLISIQGLIFVKEPFYNEPGEESSGHRSRANQYNSQQRRNTLLHAILPYISAPPKHFKDVVKLHLEFKREEILAQCRVWTAVSYGGDRFSISEAGQQLVQGLRAAS